MRKKLIAVFLLLVFLFNLAGLSIVFEIQKYFIRTEVMQLLEQPEFVNELAVITVTPGNKNLFEWENEKEFRYNGVMYDIIKKKINTSGALEFDCFADEEETKLWSDQSELVKKNNSSGDAVKNLVKFFSSVFIPTTKINIDFFSDAGLMHPHFSARIPFAEHEIVSPPPRQV